MEIDTFLFGYNITIASDLSTLSYNILKPFLCIYGQMSTANMSAMLSILSSNSKLVDIVLALPLPLKNEQKIVEELVLYL